MSNDLLRDAWSSLGIAFNAKGATNANPEDVIIQTIKSKEFPNDRKIFELMLLWIEEYLEFIHVEKLKVSLKELNAFELALMGAVATKAFKLGDHRFKVIIREVHKKLGKKTLHFGEGDDELYLKLKGVDEDFLEFGIRVAPVKADDKKKLLKREQVFKNNAWLKNRLLFGANLRADFVTVYSLKLAQNPYQAAKILNCSTNASYRNWKTIEEANEIGLLAS